MKELKKQLSMGIISGLYLFVTEDRYLSDSYISEMEKMLLDGAIKELNYNYYDSTTDISTLIQALTSLPVMAKRRMVVVKLGDIKTKNDAKTENIVKIITEYLPSPSEDTVLVVTCSSIDKRSAFYKAFASSGRIAQFKKPSRGDFYGWIENEFAKRGLKAGRDVINRIINAVDYNGRESEVDMGYFVNEIEKISMIDPKAKIITPEMTDKVLSRGVNADIFRLTDSLTASDPAAVQKQLYKLFYNNVPTQKTLATIATTMRNIALCQSAYDRGMNENDIAKQYGINPYVVKNSISCRGYFSSSDALMAIKALSEADVKIKTGLQDDETALMNVCMMIASKVYV